MPCCTFIPRTLPLLIAASLLPIGASANEPVPLATVVVEGTPEVNAPFGVEVANVPSQRSATSDTASLLRDVPGISLYGAGGVSSLPSIRGLADDRLRIKVDGMDLIAACPNHMNPALSYLDPTQVERIQVYAGVTPVSVGGDSIGGSIVVESAKPVFARAGSGTLTQGEAGAFFRSNGQARGANVALTAASEKLSLTYTGSIAQSDNYKAAGDFKTSAATGRVGHTLPLDEVGSTAYKSINQSLLLALRSENHLFDIKYTNQNIPFENFPNQRMDLTGNDNNQINLGYTGQYQWGVLKARAYHERTEHQMDFGDDKRFWYGGASNSPVPGTPCSPISGGASGCAAGMPMDTEGKTTGVSVSGEIMLSERDTVRVGSELQIYRLDDWWSPSGGGMWPGVFWNINNGERDRYALFGEWEAKLNPQWTGQLGLRHETVKMNAGDVQGYCTSGMCGGNQIADSAAFNSLDRSKTDHNWDLTALARFTPDATQTYELGVAQKTRSPNLYERYTWSTWSMAAVMNNFVGDGNGYVGNLNLQPEVARTLSLSADWHDAGKDQWGVKATPYVTYVKDFVDAQCLPGTTCPVNQFNVLQYVNQSARLVGIDVSGHTRIARASGFGDLTLSGLVNYVRGKNRDTGDNLYNIMPLNGKLALTQNKGSWSNTLEAQFVVAKDRVSAVRNEIQTAGYGLMNVRSRYTYKQYSVDLGIENLFDRDYDLPLGGAYVGQGTTMSLNGVTWGIPVPGPGRSIYAGLNVKF